MTNLKREFFNYLSKLEFSKKTIDDYIMRINQVCKLEGFDTWEKMEVFLHELIAKYREKNKRCVLPLKKLSGFLLEENFCKSSSFSNGRHFQNEMCIMTRALDPDTGKIKILGSWHPDFATPEEVADFFNIDERTLKRWRQKRIGPDWEKVGGKVHYPLEYLAEFLKKQKNK